MNIRRFILTLLCLTGLLSYTYLAISFGSNENGDKVSVLSGEILKVYLVAYSEFSVVLEERSKHASETAQISSRLENYEIEVFDNGDKYVVGFSLKVHNFPYIKGGAYEYIVDKSNYTVIGTKHSK